MRTKPDELPAARISPSPASEERRSPRRPQRRRKRFSKRKRRRGPAPVMATRPGRRDEDQIRRNDQPLFLEFLDGQPSGGRRRLGRGSISVAPRNSGQWKFTGLHAVRWAARSAGRWRWFARISG